MFFPLCFLLMYYLVFFLNQSRLSHQNQECLLKKSSRHLHRKAVPWTPLLNNLNTTTQETTGVKTAISPVVHCLTFSRIYTTKYTERCVLKVFLVIVICICLLRFCFNYSLISSLNPADSRSLWQTLGKIGEWQETTSRREDIKASQG